MLNDEPPLRPEKRFYFGWVVMPIATLMTVGTLPGQTVVVSQFNTPIRNTLGLSSESLSLAYLIGTLAAALPLTLVGTLSDRIGPRRTAALVVGGLCLGTLWLTNAVGLISLTVGFFLIRFLGQGALGLLSSHIVALWFERRLATVESIKHAVFSLAGAVVPAVVFWMIAAFGWRQAYALLGVAVAAVLLPLIAFVLRDRPEEVGQHLDNEPPLHHARWHDAHERKGAPLQEVSFTLGQALATRPFWLLLLPGLLSGFVGTAMLFHIQPLLTEAGLDKPLKAGTLAVAAWSVALFAGLMTGGPVADRLPPRAILPFSTLGIGLSCLLLWNAGTPAQAAWAMGVFGVAQGWGMAAAGPAVARFFGRPHHGAIRGFVTAAMVAGTATGPFLLTQAGAWAHGWMGGEQLGPAIEGHAGESPAPLRNGLVVFAMLALPIAAGTVFAARPKPPAIPVPADASE